MSPWVMPPERFNNLIQQYGIRLYWMKGHACACTYAGDTPGSPQPGCKTCYGRGLWWDSPVGPFQSLITFIHTSPTPDEPGSKMDEDQGLYVNGEPTVSIPYNSNDPLTLTVWQQAKVYDQFVEVDAINEYTVRLIKGQQESVPYQQNLSISASGAVTVWDTVNQIVVTGVSYTVSGTTVTLASSYAQGTNFTLDLSASPAYVAYRQAGMPAHVRPFDQLYLPRRFRLQYLDFFTRSRFSGDMPHI